MIIGDDCFFHITWQCHNNAFLLKEHFTKQLYYDLLLKYKDDYQVSIYSYCFMDTHIHMTGHAVFQNKLSDYMRRVNSQFSRRCNKEMKRRGQLVMDRFKSPQIHTSDDLERVITYIDLNPIRARMVKHPKEYKWSSYHYYAHGKKDALITPSPNYDEFGKTHGERQSRYREMVDAILQNEGHIQRNYSTTLSIGDPTWVSMRYNAIRNHMKEKRNKRSHHASPPLSNQPVDP